jgi:hypothetical protein
MIDVSTVPASEQLRVIVAAEDGQLGMVSIILDAHKP